MASRNKVCHQCLHRQFKLVTLYAVVTFLKALLWPWVPSLQDAVFPPTSVPPSLFSSPSIHPSFPRLRHPHVYHSHHVPERRSSQDSMFGHASGRSITAWLSWTLALGHAAQPWRRARPLWLVTWALAFVLACPLLDLLGLSQPTQRVTMGFWERTTFQLSPFTYCSKDVAGARYHGAVAPAQLFVASSCIWRSSSVLARRRMSI